MGTETNASPSPLQSRGRSSPLQTLARSPRPSPTQSPRLAGSSHAAVLPGVFMGLLNIAVSKDKLKI